MDYFQMPLFNIGGAFNFYTGIVLRLFLGLKLTVFFERNLTMVFSIYKLAVVAYVPFI